MNSARRAVATLGLGVLLLAPAAGRTADVAVEGLCSYGALRFEDAELSLAVAAENDGRPWPRYFLGRALRALGLEEQAIAELEIAERSSPAPWARLARREIAEIHFESGEAVLDLQERMPSDDDVLYLAGLAAGQRQSWRRSADLLGRVAPASAHYAHARYARAQCEAAEQDFPAALVDLSEAIRHAPPRPHDRSGVRIASRELLEPAGGDGGMLTIGFGPPTTSVALADRAELLRGKILYLEGRRDEARRSFIAVGGAGETGAGAIRGLLITGGLDAAAATRLGKLARPFDRAALLMAEALAAEERSDTAAELEARIALRDLTRDRRDHLERLASEDSLRTRLEAQFSEFAVRVLRARATERWREEETLTGVSCSFGPPPSPYDDPLRPADELFYTVWGASRSDRNLARLIDLRARIDLLLMDLAEPSRVAASEPRRAALRALRLAALERRVASAAKPRSTTSDDVSPESLLERIRSLRSETSGPIQGAIEDKRRAEVALFDRIEGENQAALAGVYARLAGEDEERPKDR